MGYILNQTIPTAAPFSCYFHLSVVEPTTDGISLSPTTLQLAELILVPILTTAVVLDISGSEFRCSQSPLLLVVS